MERKRSISGCRSIWAVPTRRIGASTTPATHPGPNSLHSSILQETDTPPPPPHGTTSTLTFSHSVLTSVSLNGLHCISWAIQASTSSLEDMVGMRLGWVMQWQLWWIDKCR